MPTTMSTQILDNALGAVGHTPLIRLDKVAKQHGLKCNLRESNLAVTPVTDLMTPHFDSGEGGVHVRWRFCQG